MVRTSVTHSAEPCVPLFDFICDLLLNRHKATWNLFAKYCIGSLILSVQYIVYYFLSTNCLHDRTTFQLCNLELISTKLFNATGLTKSNLSAE